MSTANSKVFVTWSTSSGCVQHLNAVIVEEVDLRVGNQGKLDEDDHQEEYLPQLVGPRLFGVNYEVLLAERLLLLVLCVLHAVVVVLVSFVVEHDRDEFFVVLPILSSAHFKQAAP